MKALDTFQRASSKTLNWAFNNSCNVADPTRLRLIDGSPIHTTGLRRLGYDWPSISAIGVGVTSLGGTALKSPEHLANDAAFALAATILGIGLEKILDRKILKGCFNNHKDLCFNTDPSQGCTSLENLKRAKNIGNTKLVTSIALGGIGFAYFATIFFPRTPVPSDVLILPFLISQTLANLLDILRFIKVSNGIWIIEETPPPRKTSSLEEKAKSALENLLPQAEPAPVPAPATS